MAHFMVYCVTFNLNQPLRRNITAPDASKYTTLEILALKKAPVNLAEVERTFSIYKNILTDRRRNLKENSLKEMII